MKPFWRGNFIMPEMYFRLRWPDLAETNHYSPSLVIKDYFAQGEELGLVEFLQRTRTALTIASDRVKSKYGFACSRAGASLSSIEQHATPFIMQSDARVTILEFSP
jgi:uncharacterized repeat protein (TIGR04042 family)